MNLSLRTALILASTSALLALTAGSALAAPPSNDNFENAQVLTSGAPAVTGNSFEGTFESGEPNNPAFGTSVWYRLNVPSGGVIVLDLCSSQNAANPVYGAGFTGSSLATLYRPWAFASIGYCGEPIYLQTNAAGPVFLQIGESSWDFTIAATFHAAPANDNFASAQVINGSSASVAIDNTWATLEPDENVDDQYNTHSLWFKWTAPMDGAINASACVPPPNTPDVNNTITLYSGVTLGALTELAADDNECTGDGGLLSGIPVSEGTTYYIRISSYFHDSFFGPSTFLLNFFTVPTNGNLADAIDLGNDNSFSTLATNTEVADAPEVSEPQLGGGTRYKSVWFKWTAPVSGQYRFDQCEEGSATGDIILGAFTSNSGANPAPSNLVPAPNLLPNMGDQNCNQIPVINQAGWITIDVTAGTTYWLAVANYDPGVAGRVFSLRATNVTLAATANPALSGTPLVGSQLSVTPGTWTAAGGALDPTEISYQWQACSDWVEGVDDCADVPGADSSTYIIPSLYYAYAFRAVVTAANDVKSVVFVTPRTQFTDYDNDADGIGDEADLCEGADNEPPKNNGCPLTPLNVSALPSIGGNPSVGNALTLNLGSASNGSSIDPSTLQPSSTFTWVACLSSGDGDSCTPRVSNGLSYTPTAADAGLWIGARVTWTNADATETRWVYAATPVPVDPAGLPSLGKSLGKVKVGKGKFQLKKVKLTCAATASGPCTGEASLSGKLGKKKFTLKTKLSVAPGKSLVVGFKLSKSQLKRLKKTNKAKARLKLSYGAPGYARRPLMGNVNLQP